MAEFRASAALENEKFNDENRTTVTSKEQINTEFLISKCFDRFEQLQYLDPEPAQIYRTRHIRYLEDSLQSLSTSYECLDSSRPWIIYWILNAAHLLNFKFRDDLLERSIDFLIKCRDPEVGGFGGGPGQHPHLATTYAAVNSLCIIGTEKSYEAIDKNGLKKFLWAVRENDGSFRLHVDGETDVRGAYCAISCAKLANFSKVDEEKLFEGTGDWIAKCQTYEGGFGGEPDLEAHGGYTFCGLAGVVMLGCTEKCNVEEILRWAITRQMRYEGGFQGRTNKLVDGCYSFWVGAIIPIAQAVLAKKDPNLADLLKTCLFDRSALQEYILLCCQKTNGGLLDKPGKPQDLYHTCYTLSGVSIAQHCENHMEPFILGNQNNELLPTHPLHNIPPLSVVKAYKFFASLAENDDSVKDNNEVQEEYTKSRSPSKESNTGESYNNTSKSQSNDRETSVENTSFSEFEEEESSYAGTSSSVTSA